MVEAKSLKVRSALLVIALVLLVFGGIGISLIMLAQGRSEQKQVLYKAEKLAHSAIDSSKAPNFEALKTSERQLKEAIALQETIPPSAGSAYQQAQNNLALDRSRLDLIQKKLDTEEEAFVTLENAKKQALQAADISQNPPHSAALWRSAQEKWQDAIKLLEKVPANTFASAEAKKKLSAYSANYRTVSEKLKTEEAALATLKKAQALAAQASNIDINSQGATELPKNKEKLVQAIDLMEQIPTNTVAYAEAKENLPTYVNHSKLMERLGLVNNQLQEQQKQLKQFVFESTWVGQSSEKQAQLRALKSQARGDRAKFIQECAVKFPNQQTTTKLSSDSSELSSLNSFYNQLCGYIWARL